MLQSGRTMMETLSCTTCGTSYPIRKLDLGATLRCLRCGGMLGGASPRTRRVKLPPPAVSSEVPEEERRLGKYRLVRRIGKGGMGIVFEAVNTEAADRRVALKTLEIRGADSPAEIARASERLVREARACAAVPPHPGVVPIYDAALIAGSFVLEMEFVDGRPLHQWRRDGPPSLSRQVAVLREAALAIDHIHRQGIVHRDIKPENVLIDREGRPRVTDFGLARLNDAEGQSSSTVTGMVVGTPTYMSPEQALKPRSADRRSDVFSLGVMLYETLTGLLPFTGRSTVGLLMSIANDTPPIPSRTAGAAKDVDAEIDAICMKALAKKPEERFASARDLADALGVWLSKRA
jgi:eukaryotic-like serine/threonine-protein kinase